MASTRDVATIAVIGAMVGDYFVLTNRLPDLGETYRANTFFKTIGGKGGNTAVSAHRSSHRNPKAAADESTDSTTSHGVDIKVKMIGALGKDELEAPFREMFDENGIDATGVRIIEGKKSSVSIITVEEDTKNNWILYVPGAAKDLTPEEFTTAESLGHDVRPDLVITNLELETKTVEQILETAGDAGIDVVFNAAPADNILLEKYGFITHMLVNESEAAILSGYALADVKEENWSKIAEGFISDGVKNVVITVGEAGAFYANKKTHGHVPAFQVNCRDPTGAGDTFTGTYAAEYLRQKSMKEDWDIKKAVTRACKASAMLVMTIGAQAGIPWADEIDAFDAPQGPEHGKGLEQTVVADL